MSALHVFNKVHMAILHETHVLLRFLCVSSNKYASRVGVALDYVGSMSLLVLVDLFSVRLNGFILVWR